MVPALDTVRIPPSESGTTCSIQVEWASIQCSSVLSRQFQIPTFPSYPAVTRSEESDWNCTVVTMSE